MDKEALDEKVGALVRDIEKMSDSDKRHHIVDFIAKEIEKAGATFLLDRHDLHNISSDAVNAWRNLPLQRKIGGLPLDTDLIRAACFLQAIVGCLRRYGLLDRIVDIKFDPEYRS